MKHLPPSTLNSLAFCLLDCLHFSQHWQILSSANPVHSSLRTFSDQFLRPFLAIFWPYFPPQLASEPSSMVHHSFCGVPFYLLVFLYFHHNNGGSWGQGIVRTEKRSGSPKNEEANTQVKKGEGNGHYTPMWEWRCLFPLATFSNQQLNWLLLFPHQPFDFGTRSPPADL